MDALCRDLGLLGGFILPAWELRSLTYFLICRVFCFVDLIFLHGYSYFFVFLYRYICIFIFTYMYICTNIGCFSRGCWCSGSVVCWCCCSGVLVVVVVPVPTSYSLFFAMSDGFYVNLATTVFYFPGCQPCHGGGSLRSREKWPLHQVPVALQTSYHGECKRIWLLQQTLLTIHISTAAGHPETCWHLQFLQHRGRTNFLLQPEVPQWLGDLDGGSPAEEQARASPWSLQAFQGQHSFDSWNVGQKCASIIGRLELVSSCLFWSVALACFGIGDNWNSLLCHEQPAAVKHSHGWNLPLTSRHLLM